MKYKRVQSLLFEKALPWAYMDATSTVTILLRFLSQCLVQAFVGLSVGQLGVFFASNSILLCGQLDVLCCSVRNSRYTALLMKGVQHAAVVSAHSSIEDDEKHSYMYNVSEMVDSEYHYDKKVNNTFMDRKMQFDIYSSYYDDATCDALREVARMCQVITRIKDIFEYFVSPLLVLRVVQVTLYLCTLLYAASLKFDMITVEYLCAVALDMFVYCYFSNQIIVQADRVSMCAYQSSWPTEGGCPRRLLASLLLANRRPLTIRAGRFLQIDLHTYLLIIKTSFSYYTLLVNMNEH